MGEGAADDAVDIELSRGLAGRQHKDGGYQDSGHGRRDRGSGEQEFAD